MEVAIDITKECRICLQDDQVLIEPCDCKGFSAYCHAECLNKWRLSFPKGHAKRTHCEICISEYNLPEPPRSRKHYVVPFVISLLSVTANFLILIGNLCEIGTEANQSAFCFCIFILCIINAAAISRVCVVVRKEHNENGNFISMYVPQLMAIVCIFFLDGFHFLLSLLNYIYFLFIFIAFVKGGKKTLM